MIDAALPQLLTADEAMRLTGIRSRTTLARIRRQHPGIAVRIPGMRNYRYVRMILVDYLAAAPQPADKP